MDYFTCCSGYLSSLVETNSKVVKKTLHNWTNGVSCEWSDHYRKKSKYAISLNRNSCLTTIHTILWGDCWSHNTTTLSWRFWFWITLKSQITFVFLSIWNFYPKIALIFNFRGKNTFFSMNIWLLTAWFKVPLDALRAFMAGILLVVVLFRLLFVRFRLVFCRLFAIGLYECELCDLKPTKREIEWHQYFNEECKWNISMKNMSEILKRLI